MKPRWWSGLVVLWCLIAVAVWWWHWRGGQHWAAYQTGTYCGSTGPRYCYWSGFGSVFPWVMLSMGGIFTGLAVLVRHVNCHEPGCPWIGKYPIAGGAFKVCGKHHPDWEGKHPPPGHMHEMHRRHKAAAKLDAPKPRRPAARKPADQV